MESPTSTSRQRRAPPATSESSTEWVKEIRRQAISSRFLPFSLPDVGDSELAEVTEVLQSGWLSAGPKARQFETEFSRFVGTKFAIAVQSGTAAFRLAFQAIGLQVGDEVLLSPLAPIVVAELVRAAGAVPRLVDVTSDGLHVDPKVVESAMTGQTKALIVSHTAGMPANMDELLALSRRHGVTVIEDAGPALPAAYRHNRVGGLADIACFSFFSQRAPTLSDGGIVCTNNEGVARHCRKLSQSPWGEVAGQMAAAPTVSTDYEPLSEIGSLTDSHLEMGVAVETKLSRRMKIPGLPKSVREAQQLSSAHDGYQSAMHELNAALGIAQLRRAEVMAQRRREIALAYNIHFSRFPELQCPHDRPDSQHAWQSYWLRINPQRLRITRHEFIEELRARDIGADLPAAPLNWQSLYAELYEYRPETCPVATQEYARIVALPIYSRMSEEDVQRVIESVDGIVQRFRALPRQPR